MFKILLVNRQGQNLLTEMGTYRGNIGKVQLWTKVDSESCQWQQAVAWHWRPKPRARRFTSLDRARGESKGPYPKQLKQKQIDALVKVYSLVPREDYLQLLEEHVNIEINTIDGALRNADEEILDLQLKLVQ